MMAIGASVYLAVGVWLSIWSRSSFDRDEDWLASLFFVSVLWLPLLLAMFFVWAWHRVHHQ